jgi:tetratricopeptide (TPR) repeat protein
LRAGQWQQAAECARRALELAPADPDCLIGYAHCLLGMGARSEALAIAERLGRMRLERADWNDALGTLFTYCEAPARALALHERAVALAPDKAVFLYNLAAAQRMTGALAAAEASLDEVIAASPRDARAWYMRSDLRTQTLERNHIAEMTACLDRAVGDPGSEIMLCFALAKELEDVSRCEESFASLQRGCTRQRALMSYDVSEDVATLDRIVALHDAAGLGLSRSHDGGDGGEGGVVGSQCIFVLGLPRSGTTLVERILASHSAVRSGGESPAFPAETIKAVQGRASRPVAKREFVERALEIDPRALGRAYLDASRPRAGAGDRWLDKQPLNYLYAGLIARALPRARIIALAREPMDSCYAMYKTLFRGAYPFTYDLAELGRYYAAWHRLMRHWQSVLGERLLIVHYEDLVERQQPVTWRILEHCGLERQEACLAFEAQPGAVSSASAVQVRRGMYSSSIGKWRRFERQLAPLARIIDEHRPATGWRFD